MIFLAFFAFVIWFFTQNLIFFQSLFESIAGYLSIQSWQSFFPGTFPNFTWVLKKVRTHLSSSFVQGIGTTLFFLFPFSEKITTWGLVISDWWNEKALKNFKHKNSVIVSNQEYFFTALNHKPVIYLHQFHKKRFDICQRLKLCITWISHQLFIYFV